MRLPHLTPFAKTPLYFFTACIAERKALLASTEVQRILESIWQLSAAHDGWFAGRFLLMPDHVHFFAAPAENAKTRAVWCKAWKSISSRQITTVIGAIPPIWQPDTFDHLLRSAESYSEKWEYVRQNPVRAGLVSDASQWPYQGEIHSLAF